MTREQQLERAFDQIAGLEHFIHEFMPMLIAGSSNRAQIEKQLQAWATAEPAGQDSAAAHASILAEQVLAQLQST